MSALRAQGVLVKRGNGASPEVFTSIGEVVGFNGPSGTASIIDVTNLSSTAKEKILGLKDEGQVTLDLNLDPDDTQQAGLRSDRDAGTERNFQIVLTDTGTTTLSFAAFVMGFSVQGAVDQKIAASVTLEVTGAVTWS